MRPFISILLLSLAGGLSSYCQANDSHIKMITYDENSVIHLKMNYGISTTIEFSNSEIAQHVALGDASAWQVTKLSHAINIKPVALNPMSNMTVWTNSRIYLFELTVEAPKIDSRNRIEKVNDNDSLYLLKFQYPAQQTQMDAWNVSQHFSPHCVNFHYSRYGNRDIAPTKVCDDGLFTYLKYNPDQDLPAVFLADQQSNEHVVNVRQQGSYLVVERLSRQLTLRYGNSVATVFNENYKHSL